jgi:hypothetical protein
MAGDDSSRSSCNHRQQPAASRTINHDFPVLLVYRNNITACSYTHNNNLAAALVSLIAINLNTGARADMRSRIMDAVLNDGPCSNTGTLWSSKLERRDRSLFAVRTHENYSIRRRPNQIQTTCCSCRVGSGDGCNNGSKI